MAILRSDQDVSARFVSGNVRLASGAAARSALVNGRHRAELTAYCRRILGSSLDAEDAVQETLLRAWRASGRFGGRSSVRTWLYRIATNVCFDALGRGGREPVPIQETPEAIDGSGEPDPSERAVAAERLRLALLAVLGALPPRQRAVLVLHEALSWRASEVAELLGTTVAGVNSALQRARFALEAVDLEDLPQARGAPDREALARYLAAFAEDDVDALVALSASATARCRARNERQEPDSATARTAS